MKGDAVSGRAYSDKDEAIAVFDYENFSMEKLLQRYASLMHMYENMADLHKQTNCRLYTMIRLEAEAQSSLIKTDPPPPRWLLTWKNFTC